MKRKPSLLCYSAAALFFTACNFAKGSANKDSKEKIITIPAIKDPTSVINNLRHKLPFRYEMDSKTTVEIIGDSTKLHIKGDSCWIEYISNVIVHTKQADGSEKTLPAIVVETTDTLAIK